IATANIQQSPILPRFQKSHGLSGAVPNGSHCASNFSQPFSDRGVRHPSQALVTVIVLQNRELCRCSNSPLDFDSDRRFGVCEMIIGWIQLSNIFLYWTWILPQRTAPLTLPESPSTDQVSDVVA